jgi:lipid-binding SYLF domain-containing protein
MRKALIPLFSIAAMAAVGCEATGPNAPAPKTELQNRGQTSLDQFLSHDSGLQKNIDNSAGYVIFPEVGKGAIGVGGASGLGTVYKHGQMVGTVKLQQVSVGPQIGGETYGELIIFENDAALNRLMNNSFEFGASAEATVVKAGAAAAARFDNGVEAYILPKGGLMAGADIHGQRFHFYANGTDPNSDNWNGQDNSTRNDVRSNSSTYNNSNGDTTVKKSETTIHNDGTVDRDSSIQHDSGNNNNVSH